MMAAVKGMIRGNTIVVENPSERGKDVDSFMREMRANDRL